MTDTTADAPQGDPVFAQVDGGGVDAVAAMSAYFAELNDRFGFEAGSALTDAAVAYNAPYGIFVLGRVADVVVAGGALSWLDATTAEVKRMWVAPAARGRGIARALLAELERRAGAAGRLRVVLDTNGALVEAIALYRRAGYTPIERYNDNPYAQHWFAKDLRGP